MLPDISIKPVNPDFALRAQRAIDNKTKPPGSLGQIEALACQIATVQNSLTPSIERARLLLFAGDHGLVQEGVSAWPSEVTTQMVANFLAGGAAANVFAATNNVEMQVVDAGIAGDLPDHPTLINASLGRGTANSMSENAMSDAQLLQALTKGAELGASAISDGAHCIALGEMGIGNTSAATLVAHKITGISVADLAGPGAGLDDAGVKRKIEIMQRAAARTDASLDPSSALATYGGFEIAMMAGAAIGAASAGGVVIIDGFIATSAALCAVTARPELAAYLVYAHRSKEPGHTSMLAQLDAHPLLDLDMRLGEGTGALLAVPLLRCACAMLCDMATFESAAVSGKS